MSSEVRRVVAARGLRGFADGFVSVLLVGYLGSLGFSPLRIGTIVTGTLLGSAVLTIAVGLIGHRARVRTLLLGASVLMFATGVGFASVTAFLPMLVVAVVGTLNPSAGDVSVFLPTEQAYLAGHARGPERPRLYSIYNLAGAMAGAFGALLSAGPAVLARTFARLGTGEGLPADRRRALELVALELRRGGRDELGGEARELAWSPPTPPPEEAGKLGARVRGATGVDGANSA